MVVGEAISLQYKMRKGEELQYKVIVDSVQEAFEEVEGEKHNLSELRRLEMLMVQKVTGIDSEGHFDVDVTIKEGWVSLKGKDGEEQKEDLPTVGQVITLKMKKNGEIMSSSLAVPFSMPSFPDEVLKPGSSWERESQINAPNVDRPIILKYVYSLAGTSKVMGYNCAEIKVQCPENAMQLAEGVNQRLSTSGTTYFAHKEGRLVRSQVQTITDITAPQARVHSDVKLQVNLQEAGAPGLPEADTGFIMKS